MSGPPLCASTSGSRDDGRTRQARCRTSQRARIAPAREIAPRRHAYGAFTCEALRHESRCAQRAAETFDAGGTPVHRPLDGYGALRRAEARVVDGRPRVASLIAPPRRSPCPPPTDNANAACARYSSQYRATPPRASSSRHACDAASGSSSGSGWLGRANRSPECRWRAKRAATRAAFRAAGPSRPDALRRHAPLRTAPLRPRRRGTPHPTARAPHAHGAHGFLGCRETLRPAGCD